MPGAGKSGKGKKGAAALPPKPALFTDEQWALAHSVSKLLELLAAADKASASKERPPVDKQTAALWLWQLLGTDPNAKDEAFKAKAVEVLVKLLTAPGVEPALSTHLLGSLVCLTTPASDTQAVAACEGLLAAKPPLVPWLLKQLEQSAAAGMVAAALGVLHALLVCAETRQLVCKIMAGWNLVPLVAALTSQQLLPLMGGRNASAHAAGILEVICSPPPLAAAAAAGGGSSGGKGKEAKPARAASAASSKGTSGSSGAGAGRGGGDAALTSALKAGVFLAGGLPALLKVCVASGSTAGCRCSAVTALCHILAAHGHQAAVKQELQAAQGLSTLVQVMGRATLPLAARAAAAGCIHHYLTPEPDAAAHSVTGAAGSLQSEGQISLQSTAPVTLPVGSLPPSRPSTSASLSKSIIRSAIQQRREQHAQDEAFAGTDSAAASRPQTGDGTNTDRSSSGAGSGTGGSTRRSASGEAAAAAGRPGASHVVATPLQLPPAPGDVAVAAVAAQRQALMSQWNEPARKRLAVCADQVIAAGALPGLLLLCCGLDGPPEGLEAAAAAAAAAAASTAQEGTEPANPCSCRDHATSSPEQDKPVVPGTMPVSNQSPSAAAADSGRLRRGTVSGGGAVEGGTPGEVLDSIAEPTHVAEGEEDHTESGPGDSTAASSRLNSAESANQSGEGGGKGGGKKGNKKSKKAAKLDPSMVEAQERASAAIKQLALATDGARTALLNAGALSILLPLLNGSVEIARWNARQALLSLSLVAVSHTPLAAPGSSLSNTSTSAAMASAPQPAAPAIKLPAYISLSNMPPSHWQPVSPPSMPPQPQLPTIPGRVRGDSSGSGATGSGAAGASGSAGRPSSQGRRMSVSNLSASQPVTQASRMNSTSSFMDGPPGSAGGGARAGKGPRTSMAMAATAAAAALAMQAGPASGVNSTAVARTSSTAAVAAVAGQGGVTGEQQQQQQQP